MSRAGPRPRVVLAAATFGVSFAFSYGPDALRMSLLGALAISAVAAGAVWLSAVRPAAGLLVATALALGLPLAGATFAVMDLVLVLVAFQAVQASDLPVWVIGATTFLGLTVNDAWLRTTAGEGWAQPSVLYPALLTALSVGLGLQSRRVRQQHAQLAALRDVDRRRAVSEERRRIARDLHDVAASHLSALVVRNGLARRRGTPAALADAAAFTEATAGDALDALRGVVSVLNDDDPAPLVPPPQSADLDEAVARMRRAGLDVTVVGAPPPSAGPEVGTAVVRIAGEAMANVLRHRGPGRCWLTVDGTADGVTVTVEDDGPTPWRPDVLDPTAHQPGRYGLLGMRERAESCGGTLEVGPSARGGWRIVAALPVAPERARSS